MRSRSRLRALLLVSAGLQFCTPAAAQDEHAGHGAEHFGSVHFPVSCSADAQPRFDRAVTMLHSFFYPETVKAFAAIGTDEPSCAMAFWGLAISQRPNPLVPPFSAKSLQAGWDAVQKARAANPPTQRERDWIEALSPYFENYDSVAQGTRTLRYEAAMASLRARYPDDSEAAVFYALALNEAVDLNDTTYARQLKAAAILEPLALAQPDHPGIAHLLIHSYDYAPIATRGLPAARRYGALAPSAPHALHMPSHIYSTLGMWQDAIRSDLASDAAAVAYAASVNLNPGSSPAANLRRYHSFDFLTNAYLQLAEDKRARAIVDERNSVAATPLEVTILAHHMAFAAIPVRYAVERGDWVEAAGLHPFVTPFPAAEAVTWFGRALGAARSADVPGAHHDLEEIARLRAALVASDDAYWVEQIDIGTQAVGAWIELAEKQPERAIATMQAAADREDRSEKNVAMENRLAPMRPMLGELLLECGKPAEAQRQFELSLESIPNRFRSLAGAGRAAALAGNKSQARAHYRQLLVLARDGDGARPELTQAREYLAKH